jgi:ABC-type Fe3+/spermidine/putrescine transport system ATPase subunit
LGQIEISMFLEIDQLTKSFGDVRVLEQLSIALEEGEILALLGLSGSGKTTALRLLAGFETPDQGVIRVAGEDVTSISPARRGFGMVFQHYALFPHMTVFENVSFGLQSQGWTTERIAPRVQEMLELVALDSFGARRVSEISGGQQQRVALARALAPKPRLLLLDEPLSNLDPALRERTRRELRTAVKEVGITTLLVTHEQEEAFHVGDRVAVLHGGKLHQVGQPEALYREPATRFVATFIGRASGLVGLVDEVGEVGKVGKVKATLRLELGEGPPVRWTGMMAEPVARGETAELVARPDALKLVSAATSGALSGRVAERLFTGALSFFIIHLADGTEVEVRIQADSPGIDLGDEVFIALSGEGPTPRVFRAEDTGS